MTAALPLGMLPLGILALAILLPLVREYVEFRREWGFGRLRAALVTGTLFPSLALGLAVSLPLAESPALQWTATVVVTVLAYSAATSAFRREPTAAPQRAR
jgi:hypothetical protein